MRNLNRFRVSHSLIIHRQSAFRVSASASVRAVHCLSLLDLFQHDIAIVELSSALNYTPAIQPICLPPRGYHPHEGQLCAVAGWGVIDHHHGGGGGGDSEEPHYASRLQAATLPILDRELCANFTRRYATAISATAICAGNLGSTSGDGVGVDACQGDSGGALACEYYGGALLPDLLLRDLTKKFLIKVITT